MHAAMEQCRGTLAFAVALTFGSVFLVKPTVSQDPRVDALASVLREITGQLERFNGLYISKLETELSATSAKLAALESTLRGISDRAVAWDNIQNHMTVWTDQSRTMERKMAILNRCHEKQAEWEAKLNAVDALNHKLTALDMKINAMTRLEFKVEQVSERIEEVFSKSYYKDSEDTLVSNRQADGPLCQLSGKDLRLVQDVSAKVDLVFDRLVDPDYDYNTFVSYLERSPSSFSKEDTSQGQTEGLNGAVTDTTPEQIFARFWKSLFAPFKKISRRFKSFESALLDVQRSCNGSSASLGVEGIGKVLQKSLEPLDMALREEMEETRLAVNDQAAHLEKIAQLIGNAVYATEKLQTATGEQFMLHRIFVDDKFSQMQKEIMQQLQRLPDHYENSNKVTNFNRKRTFSKTTPEPTQSDDEDTNRHQDCSSIVDGESGVFTFSGVGDANENYKDYNERFCDAKTNGGGWTVIQRRGFAALTQENFTRSWKEYKNGFGSLKEEFWWGNDFIHRLTNEEDMSVRFDLWGHEGQYAFAEYSLFRIAGEDDYYQLTVSGFKGNASDSFSAHNNYKFSTYDEDHDEAPECCPCAPAYGGGWWFYSCFESNLNGEYFSSPKENGYFKGIIWELWLGDYSLKATEIKIRPTRLSQEDVFPTPYPGPFPSEVPDPYTLN